MASFTWFLASPREQEEALPGWRVPPATQGPRRSRSFTCPFTGQAEIHWDYDQEPLANEPVADADNPELHGLPQVSGKLSATDFAGLIQALSGEDSAVVLELLLSLRAVGPPDVGCEALRVPSELIEILAREVRDPALVAGMWGAAVELRDDSERAVLEQWFTRLRGLAQDALTGERGMFLLWRY